MQNIYPKKQFMPQEIEVWYIIPSIRRELAKDMAMKKLRQNRIAEILGITEAAVSQYLKQKRAKDIEFPPEIIDEIQRSSDALIKGSGSLMCEMQRLLASVKRSRVLCNIHYMFGRTPQKCRACLNIIDDDNDDKKNKL